MSRSQTSADAVVVGESSRMRQIVEFVRVIAPGDSSVLITGESGTGKELIANLIHHTSNRRSGPFVPVSCAILSENLIESELFGHERGAFTNAVRDRQGRFERADGGTLFLDDIDDVPVAMQVKLLRVLQNRTVERVGGNRTIPVNVRVIAGSKRPLRTLVEEGAFREDLFYRLNVIPIQLPPLRERAAGNPPRHRFVTRERDG
jgi:transcriptional regulator with GAF, ATPase, and Fis domain